MPWHCDALQHPGIDAPLRRAHPDLVMVGLGDIDHLGRPVCRDVDAAAPPDAVVEYTVASGRPRLCLCQ